MQDSGFDQPRGDEKVDLRKDPKHQVKPGTVAYIRLKETGEIEGGWIVHQPVSGEMRKLTRVEKGGLRITERSEEELFSLNNPDDPFRIGVTVNMGRSDGTIDSGWEIKDKDPNSGRFVLEKLDNNGNKLTKGASLEQLQRLNL